MAFLHQQKNDRFPRAIANLGWVPGAAACFFCSSVVAVVLSAFLGQDDSQAA